MKAVILAGGRGQRLAPYTTILPKPLMPIGDVPIVEVVVRQLKHAGFDDITLAVGYLAELLMAYFGDGEKFGVQIHYSREQSPLGTAGPLALVPGLDEPFLVMNGDLLTTLDYGQLWQAHAAQGAIATLVTFQRDVQIDLGVIETGEEGQVRGYIEKPTYHYTVSTGIYVFEPAVLSFVPRGRRLDLPELVARLLAAGHRVATFPLHGYWLDIGRPDDYERALTEFEAHRREFLPE
ncbi:MAG: sugar phosphate nucleotidyltransferase [Anaerolineae bacterium]|jgi:NDP-sugar pyrophosphorylase family protein|nr:sugar phosphate nucleotidyltransferase [Anaerolineae bacterium]MDX9832255.1 sugar phosphate nucleotidyltransferase [Anaerolineae bacterium]